MRGMRVQWAHRAVRLRASRARPLREGLSVSLTNRALPPAAARVHR